MSNGWPVLTHLLAGLIGALAGFVYCLLSAPRSGPPPSETRSGPW
jgi:gas vesicle protein